MPDNIGLIVLGVCVFGLLFMLLGIFLYSSVFGLFRRFFVVGIVNRIIGDVKDDVEDEVDDAHGNVHHITQADIRAKAKSLDFDSAVAKYRGQAASAQNAARFDDDDLDDSRPRVIRRRAEFHARDDDGDDD